MAELGRAALVLTLGLSAYALVAGGFAAWKRKTAPRALRPQRADRVLLFDARRRDRPCRRVPPRRLLARVRRRAFQQGAADALQALGVLGRAGRVAPALAARAERLCGGGRVARAQAGARPRRLGHARARRHRARLRLAPRRGLEPVRRDRGARGRRRPQPEPAEPVHGRPPGRAVPRLRRARGALRVRDGRIALAADRRALDRHDATLDDRRLDGARRSASCSARTGRTSRWAGAATTRGIPSRTPP